MSDYVSQGLIPHDEMMNMLFNGTQIVGPITKRDISICEIDLMFGPECAVGCMYANSGFVTMPRIL